MATPNQNIYKMCMRHGPSESSGFLKKQKCEPIQRTQINSFPDR